MPAFKDGVLPGPHWAYHFLKRHKKTLAKCNSTQINRNRAAVSPNDVHEYFNNLEKTLAGIPPENIFNYDETNVSDNGGKKKLLFKRGK